MHIRNNTKRAILLLALLIGYQAIKAQTTDALGTFTPYSLFGIGEIERQGTALNRGMGGIGVGLRENKFINYINPASITARDTLSFMLDFGINEKNFYNADKNVKSAYNTFNMSNVVITAPIYKKSAFMIGIAPYSNIGYKFEATENNPVLVEEYGDIKYQQYGTGSINKFFVGGAMNFLKDFSLGAEFIYYFGSLNRHSNVLFTTSTAPRSLLTGWDYSINAYSARIGLQYFKNINKKYEISFGATYSLKTSLEGDYYYYAFANSSSAVDTVAYNRINNNKINIPAELAVGFSLRKKDKWLVGFDYLRQNWNNTKFNLTPGVDFTPKASNSFKIGGEYTQICMMSVISLKE
jgi:Outer membrane protein transport protein (OMPP1/FadL/TodX).